MSQTPYVPKLNRVETASTKTEIASPISGLPCTRVLLTTDRGEFEVAVDADNRVCLPVPKND